MPNTVSVTCPCGVVFERLIQRGRPPIWCPEHRALPVAQRPERPAVDNSEAVDGIDRVVNEHDKYDGPQRDTIEANIAAVNAQWPLVCARRDAGGITAAEADAWLTNATRDAYPTGHNKGGAVEVDES